MTAVMHPDTVEDCRERNGSAAQDRPESIDKAINMDKVGHGKGEPLVGESYSDYPSREDLSNPVNGSFLRKLLSHPAVDSVEDTTKELCGASDVALLADWQNAVETAADLHGFDVEELTAKGDSEGGADNEDTLTALLGYDPHVDMVTSDSVLLMTQLYTLGLSVVEVANVLGEATEDTVRSEYVRDRLKDVGLIEGRTRDKVREDFEDGGSKIGGTTIETPDLTVNANDF